NGIDMNGTTARQAGIVTLHCGGEGTSFVSFSQFDDLSTSQIAQITCAIPTPTNTPTPTLTPSATPTATPTPAKFASLQVGNGNIPPLTSGAILLVEPDNSNPAPSGGVSTVMKSNLGNEMFFYIDANNGLMGTASNTPFGLRTANRTRLWVAANGNIGIG